jgi:hypothetical protein
VKSQEGFFFFFFFFSTHRVPSRPTNRRGFKVNCFAEQGLKAQSLDPPKKNAEKIS